MRLFFITTISIITAIAAPKTNAAERGAACKDYDVFVLRHLEKQNDGTKDPSLTDAGTKQAKQLATLPVMSDVSHGFYTPYKRTYETLGFIEASKTVYEPKKPKDLVNKIKQEHCGETVLVVGHSNTVPGIIKALGGSFSIKYAGQELEFEPTVFLDEKDYGSVFRVTFHNERIHQQLYRLRDERKKERALQKR